MARKRNFHPADKFWPEKQRDGKGKFIKKKLGIRYRFADEDPDVTHTIDTPAVTDERWELLISRDKTVAREAVFFVPRIQTRRSFGSQATDFVNHLKSRWRSSGKANSEIEQLDVRPPHLRQP